MCLTPSFGQSPSPLQGYNSSLEVICPSDWKLSFNGYVQSLEGTNRVFGFNLETGKTHSVRIVAWKESDNLVLFDQTIELKGGQKNLLNTQKKLEPKKPESKPNFDLFKKSEQKSGNKIEQKVSVDLQDSKSQYTINQTGEKRFSNWVHIPISVGSTPTSGICIP